MKKSLKLALVLATVAILATACNNVKTTSIVGTYKNDKIEMTVDAEGTASFRWVNGVSDETKKKYDSVEYSLTSSSISYNKLIPWDLTADKANQEFEVIHYVPYNSNQKTNKVTMKFTFSKDGDNIKCAVNVSGGKGKTNTGSSTDDSDGIVNGDVELTKSLK